ncbi:DUF4105 domain-containing protein [Archangium primigenium]|uniref:Lnb N-terminal periplasmic domain-containing protein n=1 Tax=[Archangium] primigenium TaxID=2792470 RepID=UPI0019587BF8|nr:DUF4105 domain-containing protein [Archangium primigenium]MBM7113437.1 DUF4105 domain-containing protein [Archangium primigenium]
MHLLRAASRFVILALGLSWLTAAVLLTGGHPGMALGARIATAAGLVLAVLLAAWRSRPLALGVLTVLCGGVLAWTHTVQPSLTRDWAPDLVRAPRAEEQGTRVTFHDVRDFRYRSTTDWDAAWYDATYDTKDLVRAWYIVEPFSGFEGAAHTMVSFEFTGDRFLAFSVEIRRERGETYSVLGGLFRQYELIYVVGDERDLVQLRSNHRRDDVFLYPVRATPERTTAFFLDMVRRMNALQERPEFYHSLTSNCTTNLVRHLEKVSATNVPYDQRTLLPAYSDELAFALGLLDTDVGLAETRERHRINARALEAQGRDDFSLRIRGRGPAAPLSATGEP